MYWKFLVSCYFSLAVVQAKSELPFKQICIYILSILHENLETTLFMLCEYMYIQMERLNINMSLFIYFTLRLGN